MSIKDVLVGDTSVRVITQSGKEFEFSRTDDEVDYVGGGEVPTKVIDALETRGFTVSNSTWPKEVSVYTSDEESGRRAASELFPEKGPAYEVASGMGTHLELTYEVEQDGETTLVKAQHPSNSILVRQEDDNPSSAFNDIWAAYTKDQFGQKCELHLPDELNATDYEEVGYIPKKRRSKNERTKWSQFYDFYVWLVKNGFAIVPQES